VDFGEFPEVVVEGWVLVWDVVGEGEEDGVVCVVEGNEGEVEEVWEGLEGEEVVVVKVLPAWFVVVRITPPPVPPPTELLAEGEVEDTTLPLKLLVLSPAITTGTAITTADPALVVVCITVVVLTL
jgi:hypothetical protein